LGKAPQKVAVQATSRMEKIGVAPLTCNWQLASSVPVKEGALLD